MANQNALQDDNLFPALIAHAGTAGTADTQRVVANSAGELTTAPSLGTVVSQSLAVVIDTSALGTSYFGFATPGANTGSAVWQIKRQISTGGTQDQFTYVGGSATFTNVWDNRGTLTYS